MNKSALLRYMGWWPPFFGAGARIVKMTQDMRFVQAELKLHFWNQNYVGTHFGGSLYAITDPFYMLMLIENLGSKYVVWDKAATIRFKKPGRGRVTATFKLSEEQINSIRQQADKEDKVEPTFLVKVIDDSGDTVAEVDKLLWVKRRDKIL